MTTNSGMTDAFSDALKIVEDFARELRALWRSADAQMRGYFVVSPTMQDGSRSVIIAAGGGVVSLIPVSIFIDSRRVWGMLACLFILGLLIVAAGLYDWSVQVARLERVVISNSLPSAAVMRHWMDGEIAELTRLGMRKFHFPINPFEVSFALVGVPDPAKYKFVLQTDGSREGNMFSQIYQIAIFYLTPKCMAVYETYVETVSGKRFGEATRDFQYTDVRTVGLVNHLAEIKFRRADWASVKPHEAKTAELASVEWFELVVPGDRVEVLVSIARDGDGWHFHPDGSRGTDAAVHAIRDCLGLP